MKPKTTALVTLTGMTLACIALLLVDSRGADAARPLDERILDGAYHFTVAEVREETDPVPLTVYCNAYGTMLFDGAGFAEIPAGWGYGVCTDGSDPVEPNTFTYEVDPDGGVILTEQGSVNQYTTHCQVLDKGKLLLCDGTGGIGGTRPDDLRLWTATAGKL